LRPQSDNIDLRWPRLPEESEIKIITTKPEPPIDVEVAPELVVDQIEFRYEDDVHTSWSKINIGLGDKNLVNLNDSQLVLALGFPPIYPNSASLRGIEGYAVVGFSVDKAGHVFDAFIIESEPNATFDKSALKAIRKFKYKAKMVNGKPVTADGQRYLFTYKIE